MFDPSQHRMDLYGALTAVIVFSIFIGTWWWYGVRIHRARDLVVHGRALLVDVDPPASFRAAPIHDSYNIPLAELDHRMVELGSHRRPIVVCGSKTRDTIRAARLIRRFGYRVIDGGTWL